MMSACIECLFVSINGIYSIWIFLMFNIVSIVSFCFGADVLSLNASLLKKYYYDSLYNMELGEAAIFVSR